MSNYVRANSGGATHFGDKDALTTGDADKVIVGSQFDTELNAVVTASATKYDSGDLASQAQAEAGTLNTALMTPLRTEQWSAVWAAENAGMVGDIQALADPNADTVLGWDDSAGAAIGFTAGAGIVFSTTTLTVNHNAATNYVADEHVAHTGVTVTAGTGLTGGGTIDSTITLNVIGGSGITANANDIAITDQSVSATLAVGVSSGSFSVDLSSLTTIAGNALAATDRFYVQDASASASKAIRLQDAGLVINAAVATIRTFTSAEMNQVWQISGATDRKWDIDTGVGVPGNFLILVQTSSGSIDLSGGTATINRAVGDFTRTTNSVAVGICTAANTWTFYGDMAST